MSIHAVRVFSNEACLGEAEFVIIFIHIEETCKPDLPKNLYSIYVTNQKKQGKPFRLDGREGIRK